MNDNLSNQYCLIRKKKSLALEEVSRVDSIQLYLTIHCWSKERRLSLVHVQDIAQFAPKTQGQRPEPQDGP